MLKYFYWKDWDTLAYYITATATILLAIFAFWGLRSWQKEFAYKKKHEVYFQLFSLMVDAKRTANSLKTATEEELSPKSFKTAWNDFIETHSFMTYLFGSKLHISKDLYELFEEFVNINYNEACKTEIYRDKLEEIQNRIEVQIKKELELRN